MSAETGGVDLGIDELSDYRVIGAGGFSTVYSAWDEGFRRRVAVKLLHSLDEAGRRRFERERGIMGQLSSHPNVIQPFRAGYTSAGAPYLVMEMVDGGSLQELIDRRGQLPWIEAVDYVIAVSAALGHAHDQGILHRDVKPANVLLAGAIPKLTDFGIAAIRESTASQVAYTLAHCPPEAFASGHDGRDHRSDLYSLASSLHNMITGKPPFDIDAADSQQAYMFRIIEHRLPSVSEVLAPASLREFLARAQSKDPDQRPQSAQAFAAELNQIRLTEGGFGVTGPNGGAGPQTGTGAASISGPHGTGSGAGSHVATQVNARGADGGTGAGVSGDAGVSGAGGWPAPSVGGTSGEHRAGGMPSGEGSTEVSPRISGEAHLTASSANLVGAPPDRSGSQGQLSGSGSGQGRGRLALIGGGVALAAILAAGGAFALTQGGDDGIDTTTESTETTTDTTEADATVDSSQTSDSTGDVAADGAPSVVWQFETDSSLASKPAVADGVLVIGAHVTDTVHGLDIETGEELWSYVADDSVDGNPAIADGVVYVGSLDRSVHALDLADGSLVWAQPVGAEVTGGSHVHGDLVVVGNEAGEVVALDRATGAVQWTLQTGGKINSTPATALLGGDEMIVVGSTDGNLYVIVPSTGIEFTRFGVDGGIWFSTPLVVDKADGSGQEVWIGSSGADAGWLNRIDLDEGKIATFQSGGGVGTDPAITPDGAIIAGNDLGELFAVDRISLGERWREGYADETQIKGSPVVVGDSVIFGTHGKELIAVDTSDGSELWRFEGEQIFGLSAPVVDGSRLFVGNDSGAVYAFDL